MATLTLEDHLAAHGVDGDPCRIAVANTIAALTRGAIAVRDTVNLGALGAAFSGQNGGTNFGGDMQKDLDVLADDVMLEALRGTPVAYYASEELEHPVALDRTAPLAVAIDPLDGSSNIDTNVSIGTIFSVLPVVGRADRDDLASFLQPGKAQLAAGFFIYGPQLALVLTLGSGTDVFVYSPRVQTFVHAYAGLAIPQKTQEFAINAANYRFWDDAVRHYVDDCLQGAEGPQGRDFNMRWIASLVADTYRILIRGGVFLYPGDRRKGYANGRLRLVYEANPVAMLVEQAGGLATDAFRPILELVPQSLHQRVPLIFGSRSEVLQIGRYHEEPDPAGLRSPLFGSRGLFRN
ncbi:MAG: class 1 fructose-bisphosphatase [Devosia sp.]